MKNFVGMYAAILIVVEIFLFLGGGALFDFSRHYYLTGATYALFITIPVFAFLSQAVKIEELGKRIQTLEDEKK